MTKKQIEKITPQIRDIGKYPILEKTGENKGDKVEIFTPRWVVEDMFALIPYEVAVVKNGTIFEPSSGDGAFTVYILHTRLMHIYAELVGKPISDWIKSERKTITEQNGRKSVKTVISKSSDEIFKERIDDLPKLSTEQIKQFKHKSLLALSTIYAIEINEKLNTKQRNNLYSLIIQFAKEYEIELCDAYKNLAKEIIATNIIWAETNIRKKNRKPASQDNSLQMSIFDLLEPKEKKKVQPKKGDDEFILGWYMPNKDDSKPVRIAKWKIDEDLVNSVKFIKPYPNKTKEEKA